MTVESRLYKNIEAAYKEMSLFGAIGIAGVFLTKKIEAALNASEEARKSLIVDIAAQAKIGKAASEMIDENELLPEQKTMLSEMFVKDLEDVKYFLNKRAEGKNVNSQNIHEKLTKLATKNLEEEDIKIDFGWEEESRKQTELSLIQLSLILKNILMDEYLLHPAMTPVPSESKTYFKDSAVKALMYAMNRLAEGFGMDEDLKHTLVMYESDLERFGYIPVKQ